MWHQASRLAPICKRLDFPDPQKKQNFSILMENH